MSSVRNIFWDYYRTAYKFSSLKKSFRVEFSNLKNIFLSLVDHRRFGGSTYTVCMYRTYSEFWAENLDQLHKIFRLTCTPQFRICMHMSNYILKSIYLHYIKMPIRLQNNQSFMCKKKKKENELNVKFWCHFMSKKNK